MCPHCYIKRIIRRIHCKAGFKISKKNKEMPEIEGRLGIGVFSPRTWFRLTHGNNNARKQKKNNPYINCMVWVLKFVFIKRLKRQLWKSGRNTYKAKIWLDVLTCSRLHYRGTGCGGDGSACEHTQAAAEHRDARHDQASKSKIPTR